MFGTAGGVALECEVDGLSVMSENIWVSGGGGT